MTTAPRFQFDACQLRWRDGRGRFAPARRARRKSDRLARAVELAVLGHVIHGDAGFTVVSADQAHFYTVRLDGQVGCDCPDALYRPGVRCKHLVAAALATRRLGELQRQEIGRASR